MSKNTVKHKKRWRVLDVAMIGFLLLGIGVLLYPFIQNSLNDFLDQQIISYYQGKANHENEQVIQQVAEMEKENAELAKKGNSPGVNSFNQSVDQKKAPEKQEVGYYKKHTIAVIRIPKISVELPVFDLTNDLTLQKGSALLLGTSYPTGGKSTHAVISAHRGLPEAELFTDLPKLKINDKFYIDINRQHHAYQIEKIQVVEPTETKSLLIQPGRDLVTLMTCTPYMVNTQRLLVTGHRVPYVQKNDGKRPVQTSLWKKYGIFIWIAVGILALVFLGWLLYHFMFLATITKQRVDLRFRVYQKDEPLVNYQFDLKNASGRRKIFRNGEPIVLTTDETGLASIDALKGGYYRLVCRPDSQKSFKIKLQKPQDQRFTFIFNKTFKGRREFVEKIEHIYYS